MFVKARVVLSLTLVTIFLGVAVVSYTLPNVQGQSANSKRIFVIDDRELQEHDIRSEAEKALREAICREYPGWAGYSQQLTFGKMVVTEDLARILLDAGYPCIAGPCPYQTSVNPQVILTVMMVEYGNEPPPGFDAWRMARQIARDIKRLYEENQARPEVWQDRFANVGSYVIYRLFDSDERRVEEWMEHYQCLVPRLLQQENITPTPTPTVIVPPPFLERPYATATPLPMPTPMGFGYPLNSFFDHRYPIYSSEPEEDRNNLYRFDGATFPDDEEAGKSWYSGNDGMDYGTPLGVPIRAAASGKVVERYNPCGLIILEHEQNGNKIYTEYMHMSNIFVIKDEEVTAGQVIGEAGNVADNETCFSSGAHLHFGVRLYVFPGTSNTNIDPFGWWTGGEDPWETYSGGYTSRWLWWGDKAGDGHYTVDDSETQATLFYTTNWWYDENGYNGGSWWTYEVDNEEESTNWGIWGTYIETPGTYVIQAYWPASDEATHLAWYRIYTEEGGEIDSVWVDQATNGGEWYTLGVYDLPRGAVAVILTDWGDGAALSGRIRMQANEASSSHRVYFDAVRWATPTPQVTPTFTPSPTPSPTSTPSPTPSPTPQPTPTPVWGWWEAAEKAALQERPVQEQEAYSRLLSRVRDEVMVPDPKGEVYIRLVYRYAPEVTALLLEDKSLRQEVTALMDEAKPLLEEMLEGKEGRTRLSASWVRRAQAVLKKVEMKTSPELRAEIRWWREWLPRFVGKTGWEIWRMLPEREAGIGGGRTPEEAVLRGLSEKEVRTYGQLLSRIRDEVMMQSPGGEVYVALVYRYTPEVVGILMGDERLRREAEALLVEARPGLESWVAGEGEWRFSREWVRQAEALLEAVTRKGSPSLRAELAWWRARIAKWEGRTPQEVWEGLLREERVRNRR